MIASASFCLSGFCFISFGVVLACILVVQFDCCVAVVENELSYALEVLC